MDGDYIKRYVNMTNGLQAFLDYNLKISQCSFIRLQSTKLERGQFETFLNEVDHDFLMHMSLGYRIIVYDYGSRCQKGKAGCPRAIWQGLPWISYAVERCWFNNEITCLYGMHKHFEIKYRELDRKSLKRLKYYRKFLNPDRKFQFYPYFKHTTHDSDCKFYTKIVKEELWKQ